MCNRTSLVNPKLTIRTQSQSREIIHISHSKKSKVNSSRQTLFLGIIMRGSETDLLSSTIIQPGPFLSLSVCKNKSQRRSEGRRVREQESDRHRTKGKEFDWKKLGGREQNREMQQNSPAHPPGVWRKNVWVCSKSNGQNRGSTDWVTYWATELSSKSPWDVLREDSRERREIWKNLS